MKGYLKTFITPASVSAIIGGLAASSLFIAGHTEGSEHSSAAMASQYLSAFSNLAAENMVAGLCTAGAITTALVYTFIAKPAETAYKKCCAPNADDNPQDDLRTYNRI